MIGSEVPLPPANMCDALRLFQLGFAPAQLIFHPLALRQIEQESDAFGLVLGDKSRTDHDGQPAAVLAEIVFLVQPSRSAHFHKGLARALHCFGRPELYHGHAGCEIVAVVPQHAQERVVGLAESSSKCTTINLLSMVDYGGEVNFFRCQEA